MLAACALRLAPTPCDEALSQLLPQLKTQPPGKYCPVPKSARRRRGAALLLDAVLAGAPTAPGDAGGRLPSTPEGCMRVLDAALAAAAGSFPLLVCTLLGAAPLSRDVCGHAMGLLPHAKHGGADPAAVAVARFALTARIADLRRGHSPGTPAADTEGVGEAGDLGLCHEAARQCEAGPLRRVACMQPSLLCWMARPSPQAAQCSSFAATLMACHPDVAAAAVAAAQVSGILPLPSMPHWLGSLLHAQAAAAVLCLRSAAAQCPARAAGSDAAPSAVDALSVLAACVPPLQALWGDAAPMLSSDEGAAAAADLAPLLSHVPPWVNGPWRGEDKSDDTLCAVAAATVALAAAAAPDALPRVKVVTEGEGEAAARARTVAGILLAVVESRYVSLSLSSRAEHWGCHADPLSLPTGG